MTSDSKKQYTEAYKREAVALVSEQGYTLVGAARNLGINRDMLRGWKRQLEKQGDGAFPGKGHQTPAHSLLLYPNIFFHSADLFQKFNRR